MKHGRELVGLPVFTVKEGQELGEVRDLLLAPDKLAVWGLALDGDKENVIPCGELLGIGDTALTVKDEQALMDRKERSPGKSLAGIKGLRVLTAAGEELGTVEDLLVSLPEGKVEGVEVSGGLVQDVVEGRWVLPASGILTLGEDALVVRQGTIPPAPG